MILRIVLGTLRGRRDAAALPSLRSRLARAAGAVSGLESLIVAARPGTRTAEGDQSRRPDAPARPSLPATAASPIEDDPVPIEAAIVTVWRDVDAMRRAVAVDEGRFIAARLGLPFMVSATDHYEVVGRAFAALPPESSAFLRILTVRAGLRDDSRLVETLRAQQPRLVDLGVVASHVGRRLMDGGDVEAVHVSVWPDRATIRAATRGDPERPLFEQELEPWLDDLQLEMYDGIEIAPRLPTASGPPLVILDEERHIVDLTATAAAVLGVPAAELVGRRLDDLAMPGGRELAGLWQRLLETGSTTGDAAWFVPDIGAVMIHFAAGRDVPVPGRHAFVVRRRHDPAPTAADLDAALAEAFPADVVGGRRAP
jgi:PAS domain-containing protein